MGLISGNAVVQHYFFFLFDFTGVGCLLAELSVLLIIAVFVDRWNFQSGKNLSDQHGFSILFSRRNFRL